MPVQTNERQARAAKLEPQIAKEIQHRTDKLREVADKLSKGELPLEVGLADIVYHAGQLDSIAGMRNGGGE